ncbi:hypothetical protein EVB27_087 [Rhizobium phage RHph_TM16]|nr:hypothetical protein EVB27_087 [Rhizobium phage RHph_TM16]
MLKPIKQAAKAISYDAFSYRTLVKKLMRAHKGGTEKELCDLVFEAIQQEGNEEYFRSIVKYAVHNAYISLVSEIEAEDAPKKSGATPVLKVKPQTTKELVQQNLATKPDVVSTLVADITEIAKKKAQIILRDMVLPTGKKLRDSTYGECYEAGGWLMKVGELGPADEIIAETEGQLKALYET